MISDTLLISDVESLNITHLLDHSMKTFNQSVLIMNFLEN